MPIVGLDNAGKTTLLEQAKALFNRTDSRRMSIDKIPPTIGMNSELRPQTPGFVSVRQSLMRCCVPAVAKMDIAGSTVTFWDLGGHMKRIWKQYYEDANGIICVLDATDDGRLAEVKTVIREILQTPELSRKPLLVLANKRDIPGSHDAAFVTQHILPDLAERRKERAIRILAVSALSW